MRWVNNRRRVAAAYLSNSAISGSASPANSQSLHRQGSGQSTTQNKADDRDEEGPEQRREDFVHTETKAHALRNPTGQKQHEGVDDEDEQAQVMISKGSDGRIRIGRITVFTKPKIKATINSVIQSLVVG